MFFFPSRSRKKPIGRHDATREPLPYPKASPPQEDSVEPLLSAEHHVLEVRKLAAKESRRHPAGETFTVTYSAPDELYLQMAMQFMAYGDEVTLRDGCEPFAYIRREGSTYFFQAT